MENKLMRSKSLYVHTIGCQMNVYDSEKIIKNLSVAAYTPALGMETADLIILNTCAVREKAEQKAFSFLGRLAKLKKKKPELIVGVGGCVAQQEGEKILSRMPHIDFVFGTHAVPRIADIVSRVASEGCRIVDVEMSKVIVEDGSDQPSFDTGSPTRFVTIMRGCDNFCSYCVVPHVRGREISRDPDRILNEIRSLVQSGVREVTLLGQNVNSYGKKEGLCSFPELLAKVNDIEGLLRIRFTTSHPKDLSDELMRAFAGLDKLCNHIHLPVQSGSNRVLKGMNRKYTREDYLAKIDSLRRHRPDIAVTSDFIVGFPGESAEDFEATLDLIKQVDYDGLFAFMYSDRSPAPAAEMTGKVSEIEKRQRLQHLLKLQESINRKKNRAMIGAVTKILVDGCSKKMNDKNTDAKKQGMQWSGRTTTNRIVNFEWEGNGPASVDIDYTGRLVDVKIEKAFAHSLWGRPIDHLPAASAVKGDDSYAA